jgi:hypothetical protein
MSIITTIRCGPWTLGRRIRTAYPIYEVQEDPTVWCVKDRVEEGEMSVVARLHASSYTIANAVEFPRKMGNCYGTNTDDWTGWVAMRLYRGDLSMFPLIPVNRVATATLAFLRDFHTRLFLVHGDIKMTNLFVGPEDSIVVGDFGMSDSPSLRPLREDPLDHQWYYLAHGGELDQPTRSWRMDLMALGYLLLERDWPIDVPYSFLEVMGELRTAEECVQDTCWLERRNSEVTAALEKASPCIRQYFERVTSYVGWGDKAPPARIFYEELMELFQ